MKKPVIFLMGPTACGKTSLAIEMVKRFPCDVISVDSAMVYRQMDIGTAKPAKDILQMAPHRLIDILDPVEAYSAGQFRKDASREIDDILAHDRIPLLVGGTMLYFRILQHGLATLPRADLHLRAELQGQAEREGWQALHAMLARVDPVAAARIHEKDSQRIQRALEVYLLTNKTITTLQAEDTHPLAGYQVHALALVPGSRVHLHERIASRFAHMLDLGLIEEVAALYARKDLHKALPSMRAVGYREVWEYLAGETDHATMCDKAIAATRQLAKRQLTWCRAWKGLTTLQAEANDVTDQALLWMDKIVEYLHR